MTALAKDAAPAEGRTLNSLGFAKSGKPARIARDLLRAAAALEADGRLSGVRSRKLSVRVDPGALEAAAERLGLDNPSDVVNAAILLAAEPDPFKNWLKNSTDRLPEDFERAL